jgi:hypothetical protein
VSGGARARERRRRSGSFCVLCIDDTWSMWVSFSPLSSADTSATALQCSCRLPATPKDIFGGGAFVIILRPQNREVEL